MNTDGYEFLRLHKDQSGLLVITFDNPAKLNAVTEVGHSELVRVWQEADADPDVRSILVRAEGRAFSAGGDYDMIERIVADSETHRRVLREARDLVRNMIECSKPVVSAINGPAVGAGLAVGLLADVPIAGRSARLLDGHTSIGVAAGDHAAIIWPLLIGMAKAKYHLLTNSPISGDEAERMGLVALVVDDDRLEQESLDVARDLAKGPAEALRWTKHALNHWLRMAYPIFDASVAYEFLGFLGEDVGEGMAAAREKRRPEFG